MTSIAPSAAASEPADAAPPPADADGAKSLVGGAAENARSDLIPVSLDTGPGMDFGPIVAKAQKVVVAGYRVGFVTRNSASAYAGAGLANLGQSTGRNRTITQAQNKRIEVGLMNVNVPLMQAIADQLYADFVAQLKAAGKTVVTFEEIAQSAAVAAIEKAEIKEGNTYTVSPMGDARHYTIVAPSGQPLYFMAGEMLGDKGPFAQGNNKTLGAIANAAQAVALLPLNTLLWAAHGGNPVVTEMGSRRLKSSVAVPGDYATIREVDSFDTAGLANALTRVSGTQGTQFFREKKAYVADPAKFAHLALKNGFSANKAFAEAAKIAP